MRPSRKTLYHPQSFPLMLQSSHQKSTAQRRILLISTILLYMLTAMYMAALVWSLSSTSQLISRASAGIFSPSYDGRQETSTFKQVVHKQSWMLMYALGMNVGVTIADGCITLILPLCNRSSLGMQSYGGAHASSGGPNSFIASGHSS